MRKSMTKKMRMVDTYSPKHFRTSSTYRAARKQQKTATRKSFFDAEGMMVSASEWATLVLSGEVKIHGLMIMLRSISIIYPHVAISPRKATKNFVEKAISFLMD
mgnify:CR=1 FL=1